MTHLQFPSLDFYQFQTLAPVVVSERTALIQILRSLLVIPSIKRLLAQYAFSSKTSKDSRTLQQTKTIDTTSSVYEDSTRILSDYPKPIHAGLIITSHPILGRRFANMPDKVRQSSDPYPRQLTHVYNRKPSSQVGISHAFLGLWYLEWGTRHIGRHWTWTMEWFHVGESE